MTKTRTTLIGTALVAAIAIGATTTGALARGGHGERAFMGGTALEFAHFDQDGDGSLTPEELRDHATARFNAMDANGDGELSSDELEAAAEAQRAARFTRMIERMDTDGNGTVSAEEMQAARDDMRKDGKHAGKRGGKQDAKKGGKQDAKKGDKRMQGRDGGDRSETRETRGNQRFDRLFALIDSDGDGAVSQAEFDGAKDRLAATRGARPEAPADN